MTTFRIEFDWTAAMPGHASRGKCYRFSKGVRYFSKPSSFVKEDVPELQKLIAEDATRLGLKDVRIRIRKVSHKVPAQHAYSAGAPAGADLH